MNRGAVAGALVLMLASCSGGGGKGATSKAASGEDARANVIIMQCGAATDSSSGENEGSPWAEADVYNASTVLSTYMVAVTFRNKDTGAYLGADTQTTIAIKPGQETHPSFQLDSQPGSTDENTTCTLELALRRPAN